jgi:hypothetical protein
MSFTASDGDIAKQLNRAIAAGVVEALANVRPKVWFPGGD